MRPSGSSRLILFALAAVVSACSTVTVQKKAFDGTGLEIKLRSERKLFGRTIPRGFDHPATISSARLEEILGGIEIDTRSKKSSLIRERRSAIPAALLERISSKVEIAFAKAGPDQSIVVKATRKQPQKVIFDRKFLTSFVTYIEDGRLYVFVSRVDWPIEQHKKEEKLPDPRPDEQVMRFSVVTNPLYEEAGPQGVHVDWRDSAFGTDLASKPEANASASGPPTEPAPEQTPAVGADDGAADDAASATGRGALDGLSPDDLRRLADLEEARAAGRIGDADYEKSRAEILSGPR